MTLDIVWTTQFKQDYKLAMKRGQVMVKTMEELETMADE